MQILGLIGMYFDAAVVFVTIHSLLFKLALVILRMLTKLKNIFYVTPCFRSLYSSQEVSKERVCTLYKCQ